MNERLNTTDCKEVFALNKSYLANMRETVSSYLS